MQRAARQTILIVEDDRDIVDIVRLYLEAAGYDVASASDGAEALRVMRARRISLALVDLMLPGMDGLALISRIREESDVPVIIVSARSLPADKVRGLETGADGYVTKPFDPAEVVAYGRAALRRAGGAPPRGERVAAGGLALDRENLELKLDGVPVPLTATELRIMMALFNAPGAVVPKAELCEQIGAPADAHGEAAVMVHVSNIRAKLGEDPARPRHIATVRGVGYRLEA